MNNASLVLDLVKGVKRLTVTAVDKDIPLEEQIFSPNEEIKVVIRHDGPDPDDLENVFVTTHVCTGGMRRVTVPLNFDEIDGFDELLKLLCAFTSYGEDVLFHLYDGAYETLIGLYLVLHSKGKEPVISEVPIPSSKIA